MNQRRIWIFFWGLAFLTILIRLPSLEEPLDNDGGATAFHARQLLRGDELYGRFHPAHHLPAVYYTFKLAFELFGDNQWAPKILLVAWVFGCSWLLFIMGLRDNDPFKGLLAAVFFIIVSSQILLAGTMAKIESFANLPLTAGVLILVHLLRKQKQAWHFIWVGSIGAICILYKITFITPLILGGIAILAMLWLEHEPVTLWKKALARFGWMFLGLALPLLAAGGYYASVGLWDRFILVFTLGFGYINDSSPMSIPFLSWRFGFPVFWMSVNNIVLVVLGFLGTYRLARHAFPLRDTNNLISLIYVLWLVITFALIGIRGGDYPYYVLLVVPPLAFAGAFEISASFRRWTTFSTSRQSVLGASFLTILVFINFAWINLGLYSHYISYKLGQITYKDFLYGYQGTGPRSWNAQLIADYVEEHTSPADLIYVWSTDAQIYYFADRNLPVDIPWPVYVAATGLPERIFSQQTKYIIVDFPERTDRPQWLMDGLAKDYYLETVIGDKELYRRRSSG